VRMSFKLAAHRPDRIGRQKRPVTSRRADWLPGWSAHGQPSPGILRPPWFGFGWPMGHLCHCEKTAGRNEASASGSLPAQKYFQARSPSKMRPGVRLEAPWSVQPELASNRRVHLAAAPSTWLGCL
jgi:hypothetical protein